LECCAAPVGIGSAPPSLPSVCVIWVARAGDAKAKGPQTLAEKKAALKASFNAAYDGSAGGDGTKKKKGYQMKDDEPATYYDHLKSDMQERQERSRAELLALDAHTRVQVRLPLPLALPM
jgi:hypothetical protein